MSLSGANLGYLLFFFVQSGALVLLRIWSGDESLAIRYIKVI